MYALIKAILTIMLLCCSSPALGESTGQQRTGAKELLFDAQLTNPTVFPAEPASNTGGYCPGREACQAGGSNDDALETCQQAGDITPAVAWLHYNIGIFLEQKGDLNGAMDAYEHSIALDSSNGAAHYRLAEIFILKGKVTKAIAEYRKALVITPDSPAIHYQLAKAYKKAGKYHEAAKSFETAIRLDPDDLEPRRELVKLEIKRNNLPRAEKLSREILAIDRDDQQERSRLTGILGRQQKYEELALFLTEEISRYPDDSINYYRLGLVKESLKDYRAAIDALLKSIEIKASANAYYALARAWLSLTDAKKSREALIQANRIDPKRQDIIEMLELLDKEYGHIGSDTPPKTPLKPKK